MAVEINKAFLMAQLNRMNKEQLVSIIVDKVVNFDSVTGMSNTTFEKTKEMVDLHLGISSQDPNLKSEKGDEILLKLVNQLEERIEDQKLIIRLLQNEKNTNQNAVHKTFESDKKNLPGDMKLRISNSVAESETEVTNGKVEKNQLNEYPVQDIKKKSKLTQSRQTIKKPKGKKRDEKIIGSIEEEDSSNEGISFAAITKRAWLHVGRVKPGVTCDHIRNYLNVKMPGASFLVDKIQEKENTSSSSFRVGADFKLLDELNKPETWPKGVTIQRFRFFRQYGQRL